MVRWAAMNKKQRPGAVNSRPLNFPAEPRLRKCLTDVFFVPHSTPECNGGTGWETPEVVPWWTLSSLLSLA